MQFQSLIIAFAAASLAGAQDMYVSLPLELPSNASPTPADLLQQLHCLRPGDRNPQLGDPAIPD
jgi:hypothetical protein